jgi:hypothetical protein
MYANLATSYTQQARKIVGKKRNIAGKSSENK